MRFTREENYYVLIFLFKRKIHRIKKYEVEKPIDEREVHSVRGGFELDKMNDSRVPQESKGG